MDTRLLQIYKHLSWKIKYELWDMPYPPTIFWKKNISFEQVQERWKKTLETYSESQSNIWLYVHIPFCHTHCFFCTCITQVSHKESQYEEYLDAIEIEMKLMQPLFRNHKFETVYVWGGTPTILTPKQLRRFYRMIYKYFDISQAKQIMTEGSPYTTTEEKMKVLKEFKVNKMTFGVQSLDSQTLKTNNRLQNFENVQDAVKLARDHGIPHINLDLMAWIPWQDLDWFEETLKMIESLNPTTVHLNPFWPTRNTNFIKSGKSYWIEDIALRNKMHTIWKYIEERWLEIDPIKRNLQLYNAKNKNSSILWIGYGAISHVYWGLHYTKTSLKEYIDWTKDTKQETYFLGHIVNAEDEIISYCINHLRKWFSFLEFSQLFWRKITETWVFKKIKILINSGIIIEDWLGDSCVIRFKYQSDYYCAIYSKFLYSEEFIKEFIEYMHCHPSEFIDLDLKLKQFFLDA